MKGLFKDFKGILKVGDLVRDDPKIPFEVVTNVYPGGFSTRNGFNYLPWWTNGELEVIENNQLPIELTMQEIEALVGKPVRIVAKHD